MRHKTVLAVSRWAGLIVLGLLAVLVVAGGLTRPEQEGQRAVIQQAVERAVTQCYALEGAYPPDIAYVQQHYGLHIDQERYFVHYRVQAANLRPEILVIQRPR